MRPRPQREAWLILAEDEQGRWLLEQRPGAGIWGGLWCPPVIERDADWAAALRERHGLAIPEWQQDAPIDHAFSHFDLRLHPLRGAARTDAGLRESGVIAWQHPRALREGVLALPAALTRYLQALAAPADLLGATAVASVRRPRIPKAKR